MSNLWGSLHRSLLEQRPPPYANSSYWSPEFIQERFTIKDLYIMTDNGVELADYVGRYYNFIGGQRVTIGQPVTYSHTIYVFGASTVFDSEVPDTYTFTSQLQQLVAPDYRVSNEGIPGWVDSQIERRIEATSMTAGDVVIFYEPWNDLLHLMHISIEADKTPLCHTLTSFSFLANHSAFLSRMCRWDHTLRTEDFQRIRSLSTTDPPNSQGSENLR